jgi:AcrR family transcriptional regulator
MADSAPPVTRDRIIEQATRLFVTRGYHAMSMREIAEAVGVTKAALYYHFSDKEALFVAVLAASLDRLEGIVQDARAAGGSTRAQVERIVRGIFAQSPDQRAIVRLARQEMATLSQQSLAQFGGLYRDKFIGQIEATLAEGVARGELRALDVRQATWLLLGMISPFLDASPELDLRATDAAVALAMTVYFEGTSA